MRRKIKSTLFLLLCVLGLQQLSYWFGRIEGHTFHYQKKIILEQDLDPAAFFYTESKEALDAEKWIRQKIKK